jgi:hypothetical protein
LYEVAPGSRGASNAKLVSFNESGKSMHKLVNKDRLPELNNKHAEQAFKRIKKDLFALRYQSFRGQG